MNKNLSLQQISNLLNNRGSDESENEEVLAETLSDVSDAEFEISDHDTESDEEALSDSENDEEEHTEHQSDVANAFYGKKTGINGQKHRHREHGFELITIIVQLPDLRGLAWEKK
ncbi:hypothetical protein KPH14_001218 [Odynerus spinipes]|uniref:Uncharacterized protein n=1 Tax=Odynerus spinipes TaxID=1348599 RepID=A0AAD9VL16_9HYME|nr:hypothetical protein KPH14_001218 [Odynerus spinipes]